MLENILIKNFVSHLQSKFKSQLVNLNLELKSDDYGEYILLRFIRIKKSQQKKGYGSVILHEIVRFADDHNVRIKLSPVDVYGITLDKLYEFYGKQGFFLIKNNKEKNMIYCPKNCNLIAANAV